MFPVFEALPHRAPPAGPHAGARQPLQVFNVRHDLSEALDSGEAHQVSPPERETVQVRPLRPRVSCGGDSDVGSDPFVCRCVTKQNLEMHLLTHCAEKLLECEDCEFRCRSAHGLDKHYQLVHGTVRGLERGSEHFGIAPNCLLLVFETNRWFLI